MAIEVEVGFGIGHGISDAQVCEEFRAIGTLPEDLPVESFSRLAVET